MIEDIFKSAAKIIATVVVLLILIGTGCINSLMFHPVKGKYNATTRGYVDIGTNGVKVAAIVYGPENGSSPSRELRRGSKPSKTLQRGNPSSQGLKRGKKAIIRCHGNAEDALGTLWALKELANDGYTVASVDYPGYGLSDTPERMLEYLDILPGSVSVLGLANDRDNKIQLLVDEDVLKGEYFGCHPCVNTASLRLKVSDLIEKILPAVHHDYKTVHLIGT